MIKINKKKTMSSHANSDSLFWTGLFLGYGSTWLRLGSKIRRYKHYGIFKTSLVFLMWKILAEFTRRRKPEEGEEHECELDDDKEAIKMRKDRKKDFNSDGGRGAPNSTFMAPGLVGCGGEGRGVGKWGA